MNRSVHDTALGWLAAGRPAMVVEVVDFKGSVPRETGTRMLVAADAVVGTIGGGHLELQAIEHARTLLAGSGTRAPLEREIALGPSLGQCCGGVLRLRWQVLSAAALSAWPAPAPRFHLHCTAPAMSAVPSLPCWPASSAACSGSTSATASFRLERRRRTSSACVSSRSRPR